MEGRPQRSTPRNTGGFDVSVREQALPHSTVAAPGAQEGLQSPSHLGQIRRKAASAPAATPALHPMLLVLARVLPSTARQDQEWEAQGRSRLVHKGQGGSVATSEAGQLAAPLQKPAAAAPAATPGPSSCHSLRRTFTLSLGTAGASLVLSWVSAQCQGSPPLI